MRAAMADRKARFAVWLRRRWRMLTLVAVAAAVAAPVVVAAALVVASRVAPPLPFADADDLSVTVVDRNSHLLRAYTTEDGRWRLPAGVEDVDPRYLRMLLAYEDRRFRSHPGVDPLAVLRAGLQVVRHGRIVSGASTLTMQTARLLKGRHERTAPGKWRQAVAALQLERARSKDDILSLYLRLAPFGGNIEGVRAATLTYFGKEPKRLSIGEAALLVALPQSPVARRPDRHPKTAQRARDRVLDRLARDGVITTREAQQAKMEPVPTARRPFPRLAAHLADAEIEADKAVRIHRLTLDRDVQQTMARLAGEHAVRLGSRLSAAILVVDHSSGEVLAHVGSPGYLDEERFGAIDMTDAVRSPGSTLKPFIYGLCFEMGLAHPETLIEDLPLRIGGYAPKNFDEEFHGIVTIREALQQSLNVPAVKVLAKVTPYALMGRFQRLDLKAQMTSGGTPNLSIALGGLGLRLRDLATLYAALARGGEAVPLIHRQQDRTATDKPVGGRRLFSPAAAWQVSSILAGTAPPSGARRGPIAYKTGTSYGYRDAWAVGFDGKSTIAVWVGRPDGAATPGLTGRTAAAPVLFDAFQRLGRPLEPLKSAPSDLLRHRGRAGLPPPMRRFRLGVEAAAADGFLDPPPQIAFPPDRAEIEVEGIGSAQSDPVVLKVEGGTLPLTWLADGKPIDAPAHARQATFLPAGKGFVKLSVIDARGRSEHVTIRIR